MTISETVTRVALYARVSTEEQKDGQTIDSQVEELKQFAEQKNWNVIGVYKDEGWSGSLLARPALDRLRDEATAALFDLVLLNDVDRLARDVTHLGVIKRDLESHGVTIVFRKLPGEQSPTQNLMVNILGSFAEFEREMIIDRMRRGRKHKLESRKLFIGSLPPYGYHYIRRDQVAKVEGHLKINREEAAVVRQMYQWVAEEALSIVKVVRRLNASGLTPRKGGRWALSTVRRILRDESYAGVWYYNKHYSCEPLRSSSNARYRKPKNSRRLRPRAEWIALELAPELHIIDRKYWEQVQAQIASNTVFSSRNSKHSYLLRGLVRCGACGGTYVGDKTRFNRYYRCGRRCNKLGIVKTSILEETVWSAAQEVIKNPSLIQEQVERHLEKVKLQQSNQGTEEHGLKTQENKLMHEESRLLEAYRTSVISASQLKDELVKLRSRQAALEIQKQKLTNLGKETLTSEWRNSVEHNCRLILARMKEFTRDERQRFLQLLILGVIFEGSVIKIRGAIPLNASMGKGSFGWPLARNDSAPMLFPSLQELRREKDLLSPNSQPRSSPTSIASTPFYPEVCKSEYVPCVPFGQRAPDSTGVQSVEFQLIRPLLQADKNPRENPMARKTLTTA